MIFVFLVQLICLNIMFFSSIHFATNEKIFSFEYSLCVCTTFSLSIHLLTGTLNDSISWILWILVHKHEHVAISLVCWFHFLWIYTQKWNKLGHMVDLLLGFLRNLYTVLHDGCTNLYYNQHCIWEFFPTFLQVLF
jgi:hypothetical protein